MAGDKFHIGPAELAKKLSLTGPRCVALRRHTGIDTNGKVAHTFRFESQSHLRFSDHAVTLLREALSAVDMAAIWASHAPRARSPRVCAQPNCAALETDLAA